MRLFESSKNSSAGEYFIVIDNIILISTELGVFNFLDYRQKKKEPWIKNNFYFQILFIFFFLIMKFE